MSTELRIKRIRPAVFVFSYRPRPCFLAIARRARLLGRGVTAAYLTFNQAGVGSNPSDPISAGA